MPIGKNAIKRVTNNGYSNVKATAPDMENSVVAEEKKDVVIEKLTPPSPAPLKEKPKAQSKAKSTSKPKAENKDKEKVAPTPKKSMEAEPELSPVKTAEKVTKKPAKSTKKEQARQGEGYVNLGGELPIHLL